MTGRTHDRQPQGGWPSLGSVVSKLQGPVHAGGAAVRRPVAEDEDDDLGRPRPAGLPRPEPRPVQAQRRRHGRHGAQGHEPGPARAIARRLLASFDGLRRERGRRRRRSQGADQFTQQAFDILTSSKLAEALDLEREDPRLRDRYGRGSPEPAGYGDAGPLLNDYFLAARRLVEAGVRCVTLAYGRWDWHGKPHGTTFENARDHLPMLDQGLTALHRRSARPRPGQGRVGGRLGRVRPHAEDQRQRRPRPLAGGVVRPAGRRRHAHRPGHRLDQPPGRVRQGPAGHFQEVFATLYHNLGIDPRTATVTDLTGRPQYVVENVGPIAELV